MEDIYSDIIIIIKLKHKVTIIITLSVYRQDIAPFLNNMKLIIIIN